MFKRLFIAIPVPEEIKKQLSPLKKMIKLPAHGRWTAGPHLHVTILFLGDVEETSIPTITALIEPIIAASHVFSLSFLQVNVAPPGTHATMLWAYLEATSAYTTLVSKLRSAVTPYSNHVQETLLRAELPHITLARFKKIHPARDLAIPMVALPEFPIKTLELIWSQLSNLGPQYQVLKQFNLQ